MSRPEPRTRSLNVRRWRLMAGLVAMLMAGMGLASVPSAYAASYTRLSGDGSSWAGNAIAQWRTDVQAQGVTVDYNPDGSSSGRNNFAGGLSDFAVSEIPYTGDTSDPQDKVTPSFSYSLLPVVAGGTSFMYNLPVNGSRFQALQLSQAALAGIFSGQITTWNDPAIAATNPGVNLPAQQITVVVRSDGSGATAEFTLWMLHEFPAQWQALCAKTNCNPNAATSYFPYQGLSNFTAQSGSLGVTTYTANTPYTINYDEYSYALGVNFPVAQLQNSAGFFITPTATAVAVALTQAKINGDKTSDNYLSQDLSGVYEYGDPRTYPISAYSYLVVPTQTEGNFNTSKGATLAYFGTYSLCEGQRSMASLGYSPLPMNLVLAAMDQVLGIPGIDQATQTTISDTKNGVAAGSSNPCDNPTFKTGDDPAHNVLIDTAPFPPGCDAACQAPWLGKDAGTNGGTSGHTGGHHQHGGGQSTTGPAPSTGPTSTASGGNQTTTTTGSGSATQGPVTVPSGGGAVPTGGAAPSCDPDTGVCAGASNQQAGTTTDATTPVASSTVISGDHPWGGPQLAIVICLLLGVMLLVVPALTANRLDRNRRGGSGRRSGGSP